MPQGKIPFDFVLDYLYPLDTTVKLMFSIHAVYVSDKIVLGLRNRPKNPESNGIWIATSKEHHASLREDFPTITSIPALGEGNTGWQLLSASDDNFEEFAIKICDLIKKNDPRVGKIPKSKKRK